MAEPLSAVEPEREVLTWADLDDGIRELAQQVVVSGFRPDLVVAISRAACCPPARRPARRRAGHQRRPTAR
ncbi:MAG TPA: hypothetical protein VIU11_09880 [Nakamurella sp.]